MRSKDFIRENIQGVIDQFKKDHADDIAYGCKRNHCKVPATSFVKYAKQKGYAVARISGDFVVDRPEYHFDDFTSLEKQNMKMSYLDPKSKEDRIKFANKNNLLDELKKVPHFWNEYKGQIIDFTGQAQFVDSGLADDLDKSRYIT